MMFHLVYTSQAVNALSGAELLARLPVYREKNVRLAVTGLLLYKDGEFMQALEGDEATVRTLFARISQDPRHERVHLLTTVAVPQRQFPQWSMGFKNLDEIDISQVPGYTPHPNLPAHHARESWKASFVIGMLGAFMHEYCICGAIVAGVGKSPLPSSQPATRSGHTETISRSVHSPHDLHRCCVVRRRRGRGAAQT